MGLASFTVRTSPGDVQVAVNGSAVPAQRVVVDSTPQGVPTVSVWTAGDVEVTGEGVVRLIHEPAPGDVDRAAIEALRRVNVDELAQRCEAKVRAGRRDPWRVAVETLVEMADG